MNKSRFLLLALVLAWTAGCGKTPATEEAALATARSFWQARAARDAATLYSLLTDTAQSALTQSDLALFLEPERSAYASLGRPTARDPDWLQIPVHDLTVQRTAYRAQWAEYLLTLHYDGTRWRVAWAEPLMTTAMSLYQDGSFVDQLTLGKQIATIDPYHYRGPLEQHFAYQGLKRPREAEVMLVEALKLATAPQLPDIHDAAARFKLSLGLTREAAEHARRALALAAPYIPHLYPYRWEADTTVVLGRALLAAGDRDGAAGAVRRAAALDPHNGPLAMFVQALAAQRPSNQ